MAVPISPVDELVREYLVYRGMYATLKSFDAEIRSDKLASHRVERIIEILNQYVQNFDAQRLRDHLQFLETRIFKCLDSRYDETVEKVKASTCKWYMANAHAQGKIDKLREFLEVFSVEMQASSELREWFALPFTKQPAESSTFGMYFTRYWVDTFLISLHNFISICLFYAPKPRFLEFEAIQRELQRLAEENTLLRAELTTKSKRKNQSVRGNLLGTVEQPDSHVIRRDRPATEWSSADMMDDFADAYSPVLPIVNENQEEDVPRGVLKAVIKRLGVGEKKDRNPVVANKRDVPSVPATSTSTAVPNYASPVLSMSSSSTNLANTNTVAVRTGKTSNVVAGTGSIVNSSSSSSVSVSRQVSRPALDTQPIRDRGSDVQTTQAGGVSVSDTAKKANAIGSVSDTDTLTSASVTLKEKLDDATTRSRPSLPNTSNNNVAPDSQTPRFGSLAGDLRVRTQHAHETFTSACGSRHYELLGQETYTEHRSAIVAARFQPTGEHVASCDADGVVKIWRPSPSGASPLLTTVATVMSKSPLTSLDWLSRADGLIFLANRANKLRLFDVLVKKSVRDVVLDTSIYSIPLVVSHPSDELCAAFVVDVSPTRSGRVLLIDARTFQTRAEFQVPTLPRESLYGADRDRETVTSMCFDQSGPARLAVGCADGSLFFFDSSSQSNPVRSEQLSVSNGVSSSASNRNAVFNLKWAEGGYFYAILDEEPARLVRWHAPTRALDDLQLHRDALGMFRRSASQHFAFDNTDPRFLVTPSRTGAVVYEHSPNEPHPALSPCFAITNGDEQTASRTCAVDCTGALACCSVLTAAVDGSITVSTLLRKSEKS